MVRLEHVCLFSSKSPVSLPDRGRISPAAWRVGLEAGASRFCDVCREILGSNAANGATDEFHRLMSTRAGATPAPPFSLDVS
jgi:hypothetical protein